MQRLFMNTNKISVIFLFFFTVFASADDVANMKLSYFGNLSATKLDSAGFNASSYNNSSVTDEWQLAPYSKAGVQFSFYAI